MVEFVEAELYGDCLRERGSFKAWRRLDQVFGMIAIKKRLLFTVLRSDTDLLSSMVIFVNGKECYKFTIYIFRHALL